MNRKHVFIAAAALIAFISASAPVVKRLYRAYTAPAPVELESATPLLLARFIDRSPDQIAVLLMNDTQEALPAARTFAPVGIPFCVTRDKKAALKHRIVFVPSNDRPIRLMPDELAQFQSFVSSGGVLILQPLAEDFWPDLTGLRDVQPERSRKRLAFKASADAGFAYLREPEEREIQLASAETDDGVWTSALIPQASSQTVPLASYPETGEFAIVRQAIGSGFVYTLGLDLRDAVVRPQAGRSFEAHRMPFNGFEPAGDVFPLLFRAWYEHYTPAWLRLRSAPGDAKAMFLLSHNVGPGTALPAAEGFSVLENSRKVRATYFVQTKYVRDDQESPFFDAHVFSLLARLKRQGHELASHGVSATPELESMDLGTGVESIKDFRPEVGRYGRTYGGALLGELHVSKTLLEGKSPGETVSGFRSRLFSYPELLDTALLRAGYAYDSSLRAPECLTHFPFLLLERRTMTRESGIVEFPMTFEDAGIHEGVVERGPMMEALKKIAAYEGTFVWLLSPTGEGAKNPILRAVLDGLPSGVRPMPLGDAARYWLARSKTRFWAESSGRGRLTLRLLLPAEDADQLSFQASGPIASCSASKGAVRVSCSGRILTLEKTGGVREAAIDVVLRKE